MHRSLALVALLASTTACAIDPLIRDASAAGISLTVRRCDVGARFVRASVDVSSATEPYDSVVVLVELSDTDGMISHTSETAHDVEPGRVYALDTTLRVLRPARGPLTCDARLGYANP